jgi:CheY-like chemotaxis protein
MQDPVETPPKGRVLAVDDCAAMREIMCASLESLGYSVQAVDSGRAALEAATNSAFDAFILDVEMPGLDGMAVGRALRSDPKTASAVIAIHSSVDEAAVRQGFSQYDAFVPKDSGPRALGERLDDLVQGRRLAP